MKVRFRAEAEREYGEAVGYYADHANASAAFASEQEVRDAAGLLAAFPGGFPRLVRDIRRCPLHSYPYQLVYIQESDHVLVVAFMHYSRRPGYWTSRLRTAGSR